MSGFVPSVRVRSRKRRWSPPPSPSPPPPPRAAVKIELIDLVSDDDTDIDNDDIESENKMCAVCWDQFDDLYQCGSLRHSFCAPCIRGAAQVAQAQGLTALECLVGQADGCRDNIPMAVLDKVLSERTARLWLPKIQLAEVESANIPGLKTCPFCEYAVIIEDNRETLRCKNQHCMQKSCLRCKKKAHLMTPCEQEIARNPRHAEEERKTEAVVRRCPRCNRAFVKISGCNRIACPCGAIVCHSCQQEIDANHYMNNPRCREI